ncbi:hypothetical protein NFI96_008756 [Prochilodus magdalenae]|nr:hypothetical protein NFI96_008756 [Prochilodus magdalenae]
MELCYTEYGAQDSVVVSGHPVDVKCWLVVQGQPYPVLNIRAAVVILFAPIPPEKLPDSVYVEFDELEWDKREWVKVYEDFRIFLLEQQLVWAKRKEGSQLQTTRAKQIQWPALNSCTLKEMWECSAVGKEARFGLCLHWLFDIRIPPILKRPIVPLPLALTAQATSIDRRLLRPSLGLLCPNSPKSQGEGGKEGSLEKCHDFMVHITAPCLGKWTHKKKEPDRICASRGFRRLLLGLKAATASCWTVSFAMCQVCAVSCTVLVCRACVCNVSCCPLCPGPCPTVSCAMLCFTLCPAVLSLCCVLQCVLCHAEFVLRPTVLLGTVCAISHCELCLALVSAVLKRSCVLHWALLC